MFRSNRGNSILGRCILKKVTVDSKLDVAYVELRTRKIAKTMQFSPGMLVDFDIEGQVLGIEVLSVVKAAPALVMKPARKGTKRRSA
jgi:uncharacterized protein YuzE